MAAAQTVASAGELECMARSTRAEISPVSHHADPLFEQVATPVGRLDLVAHGVGRRHLRDLVGIVRSLRRQSRKVEMSRGLSNNRNG